MAAVNLIKRPFYAIVAINLIKHPFMYCCGLSYLTVLLYNTIHILYNKNVFCQKHIHTLSKGTKEIIYRKQLVE